MSRKSNMAERRAIENKVREKSGLDVTILGDESPLLQEIKDMPIGMLVAIATKIMRELRIDDYQANLYVADKTTEYIKQISEDKGGMDGGGGLEATAYLMMVACNMALSCMASIKLATEIANLRKDLDEI